ncbi:hypothetical protein FB446DRAFT_121121 [Lentinula raphanica]|nr:hypothetical protein FB446DRAFT_121121 [Lentinula raphanica]
MIVQPDYSSHISILGRKGVSMTDARPSLNLSSIRYPMPAILMQSIHRKVKGRFSRSGPKGRSSVGDVGSDGGAGIVDERQFQPPRAHSNTPFRSTCMDVSEHILHALTLAAQSSPVPYLASVSQVALGILTAVQGAKENQEVLAELATTACDLASSVLRTYEELHPSNPDSDTSQDQPSFSSDATLNNHVDELVKTFEKVGNWITDVKSRNLASRLISYKSDLRQIQKFRDQLKNALEKFQSQSTITLRSYVSRIALQQARIEKGVADQGILLREVHESLHIRQGPIHQGPLPNLPTSTLMLQVSTTNIASENPNASDIATMAPNSISFATILESNSIQESVSVDDSAGNHTADSSITNSIRENIKNISNGQNINLGKRMGRGTKRTGYFLGWTYISTAFFF